MKLIGIKRALYLFILLATNAALAAVFFLFLEPLQTDSEAELARVKGQISALHGNISNIKQELKLYQENKPRYDALDGRGFFLPQDNFMIERKLDELRNSAGVQGFAFEISDLSEIENADAKTAGQRLVMRRITLRQVKSLVDMNFYNFIYQMQTKFPIQVRLNNFRVAQTPAVDPPLLARVAKGENVGFIDGDVAFDWFTLVPLEDGNAGASAGGAR